MDSDDEFDGHLHGSIAPDSIYSGNPLNQNIGQGEYGDQYNLSEDSVSPGGDPGHGLVHDASLFHGQAPVTGHAGQSGQTGQGAGTGQGTAAGTGAPPGYGYMFTPDGPNPYLTPHTVAALRDLIGPSVSTSNRRLKDEASLCIPEFDGAKKLSVERWIRIFQATVGRLGLNEETALQVFFRKMKIGQWTSDHLISDAKHNKSPSLLKWLNRLLRSFAVHKTTRMAAVRNRKQLENEIPEHFVADIVRMAKEADPHIDDDDIVGLIAKNVHPKYQSVFALGCSKGVHTPRGAMEVLANAMSDEMEWWRKLAKSAMPTPETAPDMAAQTSTLLVDAGPGDSATGITNQMRFNAGNPAAPNRRMGLPNTVSGPYGAMRRQTGVTGRWDSGRTRTAIHPYPNPKTMSRNRNVRQQGEQGDQAGLCYQCNLPGHIKRNCPALIEYRRQMGNQQPSAPPATSGFGYSYPPPSSTYTPYTTNQNPVLMTQPQAYGFPMFVPPSPSPAVMSPQSTRTSHSSHSKNA